MSSKASGRATPTAPGRFDLESFVAGALRPYQIVTVTTHPHAAARVNELLSSVELIEQAQKNLRDKVQDGATPRERRLAEKTADEYATDKLLQISQELDDLYAQVDPSVWAQVRIDAPESSTVETVRRGVKKHGEDRLPVDHLVDHLTVTIDGTPAGRIRTGHDGDGQDDDTGWATLTGPEWRQLLDVIGEPQMKTIDEAASQVFYGGVGVTPDFFMRLSAHRDTRTSSSN